MLPLFILPFQEIQKIGIDTQIDVMLPVNMKQTKYLRKLEFLEPVRLPIILTYRIKYP